MVMVFCRISSATLNVVIWSGKCIQNPNGQIKITETISNNVVSIMPVLAKVFCCQTQWLPCFTYGCVPTWSCSACTVLLYWLCSNMKLLSMHSVTILIVFQHEAAQHAQCYYIDCVPTWSCSACTVLLYWLCSNMKLLSMHSVTILIVFQHEAAQHAQCYYIFHMIVC